MSLEKNELERAEDDLVWGGERNVSFQKSGDLHQFPERIEIFQRC